MQILNSEPPLLSKSRPLGPAKHANWQAQEAQQAQQASTQAQQAQRTSTASTASTASQQASIANVAGTAQEFPKRTRQPHNGPLRGSGKKYSMGN